jgi:DNA-binding XRE family transcriptional regulator
MAKHIIEPTVVDDVRLVREKIARQHAGDMRGHVKKSNRLADVLRKKLGLKLVSPPAKRWHGNLDAIAFTRASIARGLVQDRRKVGMTQKELAESAGIRAEILNRAERGVTVPSVRTLTKIETALRKAGLNRER